MVREMGDYETLSDLKERRPDLAEKLQSGQMTAEEWARLTGERKSRPESKEARVKRDLGTRAAIASGVPPNGLPKVDEIFRDAPTRWIAERVLKGGAKQVIIDELLLAGIPLKTGKDPRQALNQDIPYVVRRLKLKGYVIEKYGQDYVWRNKPRGEEDAKIIL